MRTSRVEFVLSAVGAAGPSWHRGQVAPGVSQVTDLRKVFYSRAPGLQATGVQVLQAGSGHTRFKTADL